MSAAEVIIKDDIEMAIAYVKSRNPACDEPLTEMIFNKILALREEGYNVTYLGSMLSNNTDILLTQGEDPGANNERLFFHLMKVDQAGKALDVTGFFVVDLTLGTVTDCSNNVITVH